MHEEIIGLHTFRLYVISVEHDDMLGLGVVGHLVLAFAGYPIVRYDIVLIKRSQFKEWEKHYTW